MLMCLLKFPYPILGPCDRVCWLCPVLLPCPVGHQEHEDRNSGPDRDHHSHCRQSEGARQASQPVSSISQTSVCYGHHRGSNGLLHSHNGILMGYYIYTMEYYVHTMKL